MTIVTSDETIHASLQCDRFSEDVFRDQFAGRQAALVLEVTEERFRVLIETLDASQAEFTVEGIWVE
jgi:hypothetical protein